MLMCDLKLTLEPHKMQNGSRSPILYFIYLFIGDTGV
jgi:hypothetical protein